MADGYSMMGEPSNVRIAGHNFERKVPTYQFCSFPNLGSMGDILSSSISCSGITQMIAAPTPDDLFQPSASEPASEKSLSVSQLLYNYLDKSITPRTLRCREAFGFNLAKDHKTARLLLNVYALVKNKGVHGDLLGMWRTMATMVKNIEKLVATDEEKTKFAAKVKPILARMDQDMKGCAARWINFECKLRAHMIVLPSGCIKCGSEEKLRECSRCRGIRYCSKDCQAADWPVHKLACSKEEAERLLAQYEKAKQIVSAKQGVGKIALSMGSSPRDFGNLNIRDPA